MYLNDECAILFHSAWELARTTCLSLSCDFNVELTMWITVSINNSLAILTIDNHLFNM